MSRHYDNAPIGNTCPIIDNIIGKMEIAKREAEYLLKQKDIDVDEEANSIVGEMLDAIHEIEKVRAANSELRDWGNEEYKRAEEAERERNEAIRDKKFLQEEIYELKAKIEELEYDSTNS